MIRCTQCLNWMQEATMEVPERGIMIPKTGWYCPHCQRFEYQGTSGSSNE